MRLLHGVGRRIGPGLLCHRAAPGGGAIGHHHRRARSRTPSSAGRTPSSTPAPASAGSALPASCCGSPPCRRAGVRSIGMRSKPRCWRTCVAAPVGNRLSMPAASRWGLPSRPPQRRAIHCWPHGGRRSKGRCSRARVLTSCWVPAALPMTAPRRARWCSSASTARRPGR